MPAIASPPTKSTLSSNGAAYQSPAFNGKTRLALLVEAKIVLLNYKGGTNYIGNHKQLTIDAEAAYFGQTPDAWGAVLGDTMLNFDPGPCTVGLFVEQANYRDSTNMPSTVSLQMTKIGEQYARPSQQLQKQNAFLDLLLLAIWG